ncbi:MAG: hypothetical protein N2606_07820 [Candidatus Omnitrophica bacterium]|nr:hypothetical protein [Candidatus Omnitrophota bacterium]
MFSPYQYKCGLDIGSSKIAACLAVIKGQDIVDIFFDSQKITGVRYGTITDSAKVVEGIRRVLVSLRAKVKVPIRQLYTNISGQDIHWKTVHTVIPLTERGTKLINSLDVERITQQVLLLGSSLDEEIIHHIPLSFSVDNKTGIRNPEGMAGHTLAVEMQLICAKISALQTISYAVQSAACEARDISFSGLATAEVVFDDTLRHGVNILIDMGADITEILIFSEGLLQEIILLHTGGNDLTRLLMERFSLPFEVAEELKLSCSMDNYFSDSAKEKETLVKSDGQLRALRQKEVISALSEKTKTICLLLKDELERKIKFSEIKNCFFCGQAVLQEGFLEVAEHIFGIPVELARIREHTLAAYLSSNIQLGGLKYMTYLTALGLVVRHLSFHPPKILETKNPSANFFQKAYHKLWEIYQEYF